MPSREPHWVKLFLRELERTGNVRISAERAGVDYTSAYQRRKRHGEFAERWEGALRDHASRSAQDNELELDDAAPSAFRAATSPASAGEETVVRPDGKVIKGSEARWGKRAEGSFLTELTVSGNVRMAAKAAGFSTTAVYKQRLKSRHFAATWDAAVETGKARVQAYLVEAATRTFDPDELPIGEEWAMPAVSVGEAINIAKLPPAGGRGGGRKDKAFDGWEADHAEYQEACERIIERLERMKAQSDAEERATGLCHSCGQTLPESVLGA